MAVPESRDPEPPPSLDLRGVALATLGLTLLVLGTTQIERAGLAAAVTLLPLAPGLMLLALFGTYLQEVLGYSAFEAGVALVPMAIASAAGGAPRRTAPSVACTGVA